MPDQSTAATEHSLMQEITAPLSTIPDDPLPAVADVDFPIVLRGYDRLAVDAYVKETSQLVAELQATRSPEAAVRRALGRVGEEVSSILQRAHETAEQLTAQSRSEAEERLEAARREAQGITAGARTQVAELDSETDRIWAERHRIVEDARELASSLLALAESAAERFPAATEDVPAVDEPGEAEALDKWDEEALDNWDEHDEPHGAQAGDPEPLAEELFSGPGEKGDQEGEATTAMPPVVPAEPPADPTEETRKLQ
jgi:cell division septum initiation protein DivIVA